MRDLYGMSDSALRDEIMVIKERWRAASDERKAMIEAGTGGYGSRNPKWLELERIEIECAGEISEIVESGQLPWVRWGGGPQGSRVDDSTGGAVVTARRAVSDTLARSPHSRSDGRVIELKITNGGTYSHSMVFVNPETVQQVIEQLQMELDGWGLYDPSVNYDAGL